jgi:signal transduction histidine kinase
MSASQAADIFKYKILVVDDSEADRLSYKRLLQRSGVAFDIREAGSMSDGLAAANDTEVDCVLVDYRLPDGDGIDFIRACKEKGLEPDAAIVMVTGQGSEQTAVEAMKLGALDYIAKNTIFEGFFTQSILNAIERAHLKRQVRQYQQELEKSYMALSEFTHTVSHDLKAPLRRIGQFCDLLRDEVGDRLGVDGTEYVTRLGVNARRLQRLVDDLLTYSRTLNSRDQKTDIDLKKILAEVVDDLDVLVKETKAKVIVGEMPVLPGYQVRIRELFQNLISNALKYRGKNDPVIEVGCERTNGFYTFSVKDNGEGIDPKYHQSIFKAFERLHTQDEIEGSGLGLSICSKIVEMHKGKIWVESNDGPGVTFKFTLPRE